jgi:hypothetical protein
MPHVFLPGEEEFKRWIRESVREEMKAVLLDLKTNSSSKEEPLMTRKEIGAYLRISLVTLTDWKKRGLPCRQHRGRVLFLKSEVLKWLKENKNEEE